MDTSLKLMSMETGYAREYEYDADEELLWVTDFDPGMQCVQKNWHRLNWNPIEHIRRKAMGLDTDTELDID